MILGKRNRAPPPELPKQTGPVGFCQWPICSREGGHELEQLRNETGYPDDKETTLKEGAIEAVAESLSQQTFNGFGSDALASSSMTLATVASPSSSIEQTQLLPPADIVLGQLPQADIIVGHLRRALGMHPHSPAENYGALVGIRDQNTELALQSSLANLDSIKHLLDAHPALAHLFAKNAELRSAIETAAETITSSLSDDGSSVSATRVLWTMCSCVWRSLSIVVGDICVGHRAPASLAATSPSPQRAQADPAVVDASPSTKWIAPLWPTLDAHLRYVLQANDELRATLAKLRRDYLRELTALRERCRRLDAPLEEALTTLLDEEPVMFFEPFDFVLDDSTKDFVRDTVEEKLRLLLLKGWRKVGDDELETLHKRIEELEVENTNLRAELEQANTCETPRMPSCFITSALTPEREDMSDVEIDSDGGDSEAERLARIADLEAELARLLQDKASRTNRLLSMAASKVATPGSRDRGENNRSSLYSSTPCRIARDPEGYLELQQKHKVLQRRYQELKRRFQKFTDRLNENMELKGYDTEVINEALTHAGLEKPVVATKTAGKDGRQATFDRLYDDALRRMQRLRQRSAELHSMQRIEIHRCWEVATSPELSVQTSEVAQVEVKHLRGLQSTAVTCTGSLNDALENFHAGQYQPLSNAVIAIGHKVQISEPRTSKADEFRRLEKEKADEPRTSEKEKADEPRLHENVPGTVPMARLRKLPTPFRRPGGGGGFTAALSAGSAGGATSGCTSHIASPCVSTGDSGPGSLVVSALTSARDLRRAENGHDVNSARLDLSSQVQLIGGRSPAESRCANGGRSPAESRGAHGHSADSRRDVFTPQPEQQMRCEQQQQLVRGVASAPRLQSQVACKPLAICNTPSQIVYEAALRIASSAPMDRHTVSTAAPSTSTWRTGTTSDPLGLFSSGAGSSSRLHESCSMSVLRAMARDEDQLQLHRTAAPRRLLFAESPGPQQAAQHTQACKDVSARPPRPLIALTYDETPAQESEISVGPQFAALAAAAEAATASSKRRGTRSITPTSVGETVDANTSRPSTVATGEFDTSRPTTVASDEGGAGCCQGLGMTSAVATSSTCSSASPSRPSSSAASVRPGSRADSSATSVRAHPTLAQRVPWWLPLQSGTVSAVASTPDVCDSSPASALSAGEGGAQLSFPKGKWQQQRSSQLRNHRQDPQPAAACRFLHPLLCARSPAPANNGTRVGGLHHSMCGSPSEAILSTPGKVATAVARLEATASPAVTAASPGTILSVATIAAAHSPPASGARVSHSRSLPALVNRSDGHRPSSMPGHGAFEGRAGRFWKLDKPYPSR